MEYAVAKFKELALDFALKVGPHLTPESLVTSAKVIEAYLKEEK